jgi:hypothetical protein
MAGQEGPQEPWFPETSQLTGRLEAQAPDLVEESIAILAHDLHLHGRSPPLSSKAGL